MESLPNDLVAQIFNGCPRSVTCCTSKALARKLIHVTESARAQEQAAVLVRQELFERVMAMIEQHDCAVVSSRMEFMGKAFLMGTFTQIFPNGERDTGVLTSHITTATPWSDGFGGLTVHMHIENRGFVYEHEWGRRITIQPCTTTRGMLTIEFLNTDEITVGYRRGVTDALRALGFE